MFCATTSITIRISGKDMYEDPAGGLWEYLTLLSVVQISGFGKIVDYTSLTYRVYSYKLCSAHTSKHTRPGSGRERSRTPSTKGHGKPVKKPASHSSCSGTFAYP